MIRNSLILFLIGLLTSYIFLNFNLGIFLLFININVGLTIMWLNFKGLHEVIIQVHKNNVENQKQISKDTNSLLKIIKDLK